jgi:hypothetical protein
MWLAYFLGVSRESSPPKVAKSAVVIFRSGI